MCHTGQIESGVGQHGRGVGAARFRAHHDALLHQQLHFQCGVGPDVVGNVIVIGRRVVGGTGTGARFGEARGIKTITFTQHQGVCIGAFDHHLIVSAKQGRVVQPSRFGQRCKRLCIADQGLCAPVGAHVNELHALNFVQGVVVHVVEQVQRSACTAQTQGVVAAVAFDVSRGLTQVVVDACLVQLKDVIARRPNDRAAVAHRRHGECARRGGCRGQGAGGEGFGNHRRGITRRIDHTEAVGGRRGGQ